VSGRLEFPGESRYVVTAPLVMVRRMTVNQFVNLFEGERVPADIDPKQRDHLLASAMIQLSGGS
jgi:hypothetical protein